MGSSSRWVHSAFPSSDTPTRKVVAKWEQTCFTYYATRLDGPGYPPGIHQNRLSSKKTLRFYKHQGTAGWKNHSIPKKKLSKTLPSYTLPSFCSRTLGSETCASEYGKIALHLFCCGNICRINRLWHQALRHPSWLWMQEMGTGSQNSSDQFGILAMKLQNVGDHKGKVVPLWLVMVPFYI